MTALLSVFLHLDKHLADVISQYGGWTYLILFAIVFCETGLVVTPLLPGDSLLFAAGTFAATGVLGAWQLAGLLAVAAILGDTVNYGVGAYIGPRAFSGDIRFLKKEYLDRTRDFYAKYGGKTIIIARFVPIVRTFAPFVAGVGSMSYARFLTYNVSGGVLWIALFLSAGFWFGNLEVVRKNFSLVIMAIIFVSLLPGVFEYLSHRRQTRASGA